MNNNNSQCVCVSLYDEAIKKVQKIPFINDDDIDTGNNNKMKTLPMCT
jgi:hypothetical protein